MSSECLSSSPEDGVDVMRSFNRDKHKRRKHKHSHGIALVRFNGERTEILLVRKRHTYAFITFVFSNYDTRSNDEVLRLLNKMTAEEKLILRSLDFKMIWYHVWLTDEARPVQELVRSDPLIRLLKSKSQPDMGSYIAAKNKFESAFKHDNGKRLKELIAISKSVQPLWEIPKGQRNGHESDIQAAIREFQEETSIPPQHYRLFPNESRSFTFIDDIKYTYTYWLAFTRRNIVPRIDFRTEQPAEISDIKWMSIEDIRRVDATGQLERFIRPIFKWMRARMEQ